MIFKQKIFGSAFKSVNSDSFITDITQHQSGHPRRGLQKLIESRKTLAAVYMKVKEDGPNLLFLQSLRALRERSDPVACERAVVCVLEPREMLRREKHC